MMKKIATTLALAMISVAMFAQIDFNLFVRDVGNYARNYSDDQVMGLYEDHYGVPRQTLLQIFGGFGNDWGNVTLGLEMSNLLGVPVGELMGYNRDHSRSNGWGEMARRYGIKPGSPEFHRMKAMMSQKHGYWRDVFNDYGKYHEKRGKRIRKLQEKEMKAWEKQAKWERKQQEKSMKAWEKEEKKIRKEQEKWMKKGGRW